jgi:PAS domain S-box-containing protein
MALGIHYISHFRRMDSYPVGYSNRSNRHTTASRQAGAVDNTLPNFVSVIYLAKKKGLCSNHMKKARKKRERNLLEETAKIYQSITRDSMDGFWIVDMQSRFLDVNNAYCRLIGYSRRELLKMKIADIEVWEKPDEIASHLQRIMEKGESRFLTQHRKKDGKIIDVEASANYANYLGGFVFVFIRDITERKQAEEKMMRNRANSKKIIETQLADSYKHLGLINRKISLLLELGEFPKSKKHRQDVIDHVLNLAMNISKVPTGYLYSSEGKGKFNLLSYRGVKEDQKEKIKVITSRTVGLLRHLVKEKGFISGDIKRYEAELLALDNKLEYFVTLPLSKGTSLGGFIFLGFDKKKSVDTQDLEFLDVFAMHASSALTNAGVLK